MEKPRINKEQIQTDFESRYISVYDLQYSPGRHYYNASRRKLEDQTCIKSDEEFKNLIPDAVSCFVIITEKGQEPKLLMSREFRYPTGQFLLSPPAGLIDPEDKAKDQPLFETAKREIFEETGLRFKKGDKIDLVSQAVFGSPGMTDESNGIVCVQLFVDDLTALTQSGAEATELFDGFLLLDKKQARQILKEGKDEEGIYFSVYTWMALAWFVGDFWKE